MFYLILLSQAAPNKLSKFQSTCVNIKSENELNVHSKPCYKLWDAGKKRENKKSKSLKPLYLFRNSFCP